jgi:hypothetical protein
MATHINAYRLDQFRGYLAEQWPRYGIEASVLHHTWSPDADSWGGMRSMLAIKRYHMNERGFSDIAANAYAAPDGQIYNGRPLSSRNYAHSLVSKQWKDVPADVRTLCQGDELWLNHHAFGIETVGNFDKEDPAKSKALGTALDVLALVHRQFELPPERMFFHRHVADKSCPGDLVDLDWARGELAARLAKMNTKAQVFLMPGSILIDCYPRNVGGRTRCDLRPLVEAVGGEIYWDNAAKSVRVFLDGNEISLNACDVKLEGQRLRCNLRITATHLGLVADYDEKTERTMLSPLRGAIPCDE